MHYLFSEAKRAAQAHTTTSIPILYHFFIRLLGCRVLPMLPCVDQLPLQYQKLKNVDLSLELLSEPLSLRLTDSCSSLTVLSLYAHFLDKVQIGFFAAAWACQAQLEPKISASHSHSHAMSGQVLYTKSLFSGPSDVRCPLVPSRCLL